MLGRGKPPATAGSVLTDRASMILNENPYKQNKKAQLPTALQNKQKNVLNKHFFDHHIRHLGTQNKQIKSRYCDTNNYLIDEHSPVIPHFLISYITFRVT